MRLRGTIRRIRRRLHPMSIVGYVKWHWMQFRGGPPGKMIIYDRDYVPPK